MSLKVRIIFFAVVLFVIIYNSGRSYYNKDVAFYDEEIRAVINKIKRTRGIKVYYNDSKDFFYLGAYKGVPLIEGDSIVKVNQKIKVYRKTSINNYKLIGTGEPIKQPSYFVFFFF